MIVFYISVLDCVCVCVCALSVCVSVLYLSDQTGELAAVKAAQSSGQKLEQR